MKTTFIYALCEPGTRTVRYIGKADNLKKRLSRHLSASIKLKTHLGDWLRSLRFCGERPVMVVLREVPYDNWELAEERFIRLARGCKMDLVNATDGGEGVTMTPEIRGKISVRHRGRVFSEETRVKMSRAKAGTTRGPMSEEQKEKISAANKGQISHNKGVPMTEAQKCKISVANSGERNKQFGIPRTLAEKMAISVGLRAAWAKRKGANV